METALTTTEKKGILKFDLESELHHGMDVSNLAYEVAKELSLSEAVCHDLAVAGMLHDIGKLKLTGYINGQEQNALYSWI